MESITQAKEEGQYSSSARSLPEAPCARCKQNPASPLSNLLLPT